MITHRAETSLDICVGSEQSITTLFSLLQLVQCSSSEPYVDLKANHRSMIEGSSAFSREGNRTWRLTTILPQSKCTEMQYEGARRTGNSEHAKSRLRWAKCREIYGVRSARISMRERETSSSKERQEARDKRNKWKEGRISSTCSVASTNSGE